MRIRRRLGWAPLVAAGFALLSACQRLESDLDYFRARNALAEERFDQARHYFAADLALWPERFESLHGAGIAWSQGTGNSQSRAITFLEKCLALAPENAEIRLRLARTYDHRGEPGRALQVLGKVPATSGKVSGTHLETVLLRARLQLDGAPEQTAADLAEALLLWPEEESLLALAAEVQERLGNPEQALDFVRRTLNWDPFRARTVYLKARLLRRLGDEQGAALALETWELLRQLETPSAPSLAPSDEWRIIEEIGRRSGTGSTAYKVRAVRSLFAQDRFDEASLIIEQLLIKNRPLKSATWIDLGRLAQERGRILLAQRLFDHVLEREGDHLTALAQQAFLALETGRKADATPLVARGLANDPHHAPLNFMEGLLALEEQDSKRAIAALRRAVELAPWEGRYRLTLAELYLSLGQRDELAELFEAAHIAPSPPDPELVAFEKRHLP